MRDERDLKEMPGGRGIQAAQLAELTEEEAGERERGSAGDHGIFYKCAELP